MIVTMEWISDRVTCRGFDQRIKTVFPSGRFKVTLNALRRLERANVDLEQLALELLDDSGYQAWLDSCPEMYYAPSVRGKCAACDYKGEDCAAVELWNQMCDGHIDPGAIEDLGEF